MYALCDANSFYASCEKVFDPSIRNKPVVVLTNNDGCICAACHIAKRVGVGKKFVPYFQVAAQLRQAGAVIRSSNYELYADLSQKMMDVCARFAPIQHIYSIDECFLKFTSNEYRLPGVAQAENWFDYARHIRRAVWQQVRLPIGVGIGETPTLAKAANHAAKRLPGFRGVAVIDSETKRRQVLSQMALTDVWGIGSRLAKRLAMMGIKNALQLSNCNPNLMRKSFSVVMERTVRELNGEVCLSWDDVRANKKEIFSTRSFGQRVQGKSELRLALSRHAAIAAEKARKQQSLVSQMVIFASNSPHDQHYYKQSQLQRFVIPTNDSRYICQAAAQAADTIYQPGVLFYRCGVGLLELVDEQHYQHDLFHPSTDNQKLMQCLDQINQRYGNETLQLAGQGIVRPWTMKRQFLSPQYTTRWRDIPKIQC
ncbi:Y-family DNA polymerase [Thalassotalea aquiviva]|uniref:Y-family DNA polymerase n=1 Tax=Thalassotalea aquiviva TaxID=3242415 RepID=UPI00352ADB77